MIQSRNPVFQAERTYLRQFRLLRWKYWPYHLLFVLGLFSALLPFWFYITIDYTRLLAALTISIFSVHFIISLRTLVIAARSITHNWEATIASGADAQQIVRGKWWATVHYVWRWHLFAALLKIGLGLAVAQHVYDGAYHDIYSDLFALLDYPNLGFIHESDVQPALYQFAIVLVVALILGLLQALLLPALGMLCGLIARRHVAPAFIAITVYLLLQGFVFALAVDCNQSTYYAKMYNTANYLSTSYRLLKVSGALTIGDGGTLVLADLLRPIQHHIHLLRCSGSVALGILLHLVGLLLFLWAARILAVRMGAPAPVPVIPRLKACFVRWTHTPIIRFQMQLFRQNQREHPWLRIGLLALLVLALAVAWIPRWQLIDCTRGGTLRIIIGAAYAAHFVVVLQTLFFAIHTLHRENQAESWDVLVLTGISARQLVFGKWWAVLRITWPYHAFTAIIKLGLVWGLVQYLYSLDITPPYTSTERFFAYISGHFASAGNCNYPYRGPVTYLLDQSYLRSFRIGAILIGFSFLEAALSAAIGILSAVTIRKHTLFRLGTALFLRLTPILLAFVFLYSYTTLKAPPSYNGYAQYWADTKNRHTNDLIDTLQVAASTQMDGGIAALNLTNTYSYARNRQYAALFLGALSYVALIVGALWAAERITIRRGMLAHRHSHPQ